MELDQKRFTSISCLKELKKVKSMKIILATNFTTEGNTTAQYIAELLKESKINITRIARGLPMGGEIEYVDSGTLAQSIVERKKNNLNFY